MTLINKALNNDEEIFTYEKSVSFRIVELFNDVFCLLYSNLGLVLSCVKKKKKKKKWHRITFIDTVS